MIFIKGVWNLEASQKRARGRSKLNWKDVIMKDMDEKMIEACLVNDRASWRAVIRSLDPKRGTKG